MNMAQHLLQNFGWDHFDHPLYGPNLAPSEYNIFFAPFSFFGIISGRCDTNIFIIQNNSRKVLRKNMMYLKKVGGWVVGVIPWRAGSATTG